MVVVELPRAAAEGVAGATPAASPTAAAEGSPTAAEEEFPPRVVVCPTAAGVALCRIMLPRVQVNKTSREEGGVAGEPCLRACSSNVPAPPDPDALLQLPPRAASPTTDQI